MPERVIFEGIEYDLGFRNKEQGGAVYAHHVSNEPYLVSQLGVDRNGEILWHYEIDGKDQVRDLAKYLESQRLTRERTDALEKDLGVSRAK